MPEEKKEHEHSDPPKPDDQQGKPAGDGGSESGSDGGSGDGDIAAIVKAEVQKALAELRTAGGSQPAPSRRLDMEEEAKRMVKEAAAKLEADKAHQEEHKTVAELAEKAKKEAEKTPMKVRRLTRALWGSGEEEGSK